MDISLGAGFAYLHRIREVPDLRRLELASHNKAAASI
jgi:hypothetical protein